MQAEIENVVRAYKMDVRKEQELLFSILASLAVRSRARQRMTTEIAEAVLKCRQKSENLRNTAPQSPIFPTP